jgi:hypothetical protein
VIGMSGWGSNRSQGLASARQLVEALSRGWRPSPIGVPLHLPEGERCFTREQVEVFQFTEGEASYTHKSTAGYGLMGLAMATATHAGNKRRARRALRQAEARFRKVDEGTMYLTNRRFAIQGKGQWVDLWFDSIRMSNCDGEAIELQLANNAPLALRVWPADYHFALFRWLAHGELVQPPQA